jgi:hypothetical protein
MAKVLRPSQFGQRIGSRLFKEFQAKAKGKPGDELTEKRRSCMDGASGKRASGSTKEPGRVSIVRKEGTHPRSETRRGMGCTIVVERTKTTEEAELVI